MPARRWSQAAALSLLVPAICLLFAVAAYAQGSPPPSPTAGGQQLPGDPAKGQQLYAANCATCHGSALEGNVGPKLAPIAHLGNVADPLDPAYLIEVITNGLEGAGSYKIKMAPKGGNPKLTDQDVKDLAAFIIDSNLHPGEQPLSPGDLARSNVFWVGVGIGVMALFTYLLAQYNMRWVARRAAAARKR